MSENTLSVAADPLAKRLSSDDSLLAEFRNGVLSPAMEPAAWAAAWNWHAERAEARQALDFGLEAPLSAADVDLPFDCDDVLDGAWGFQIWGDRQWRQLLPALSPAGLRKLTIRAAGDTVSGVPRLELLFDFGVDPKAPVSPLGSTALMAAAQNSAFANIRFLAPLSDTQAVNARGDTALCLLAERDLFDPISTELRERFISELRPASGLAPGRSALLFASLSRSSEAEALRLVQLLAPCCDLFEEDALARTALYYLCVGSHSAPIRFLANAMVCADPARAKEVADKTALLILATGLGDKKTLPLLDVLCAMELLPQATEEAIVANEARYRIENLALSFPDRLAPAAAAACERRALLAEVASSRHAQASGPETAGQAFSAPSAAPAAKRRRL